MEINDLQNHFNHDEDEEHEPQIFKQTAYIDLLHVLFVFLDIFLSVYQTLSITCMNCFKQETQISENIIADVTARIKPDITGICFSVYDKVVRLHWFQM